MHGLPAYTDYASEHGRRLETGLPARARWPYLAIGVIGAALIAVPLLLGMFTRAAQGQEMLAGFAPYMSNEQVGELRTDLAVVDRARRNILTLREQGRQPAGNYRHVDDLVRDYPAIRADMSGMVDSMGAVVGDYRRLASLPPFGLFPWLFALPGAILVGVGVFGARRAAAGRRTPVLTGVAALVAAGLILAPFAFDVFGKSPSAQPLIDRFTPVLTHDRVRTVQSYFVTLVGGQGELNSRYTAAIPAGADRGGIDALAARWQPMTARFAGLVGAMNDNVGNFDGAVALDDSTKPLGFAAFGWFGWFFLVPGVALVAAIGAGPLSRLRRRRLRRQQEQREAVSA